MALEGCGYSAPVELIVIYLEAMSNDEKLETRICSYLREVPAWNVKF